MSADASNRGCRIIISWSITELDRPPPIFKCVQHAETFAKMFQCFILHVTTVLDRRLVLQSSYL